MINDNYVLHNIFITYFTPHLMSIHGFTETMVALPLLTILS